MTPLTHIEKEGRKNNRNQIYRGETLVSPSKLKRKKIISTNNKQTVVMLRDCPLV